MPVLTWWDHAEKKDGTPAHMFWDVARITRGAIPGLQPDPLVPGNVLGPSLSTGTSTLPERLTLTLWFEAVGMDVLDDLVESKHLDPELKQAVPRYSMIPRRLASETYDGSNVTLEWTLEAFRADQKLPPDAQRYYDKEGLECLAAPR